MTYDLIRIRSDSIFEHVYMLKMVGTIFLLSSYCIFLLFNNYARVILKWSFETSA
jgi:hypothetical protein